ncbi:MAG: hypothetical protein COT81_05385 [Candidatus Buchananbacteria bacterium CG10_big_fil_rev_8_21_14_0_10_42_9]|uniref:Polymerase nucleotidyl transferase domain-containing protein n=1 Tax=Candidatus Buchananbacteria bacterium CG10_big_fil_rev_8_21_14_0_10_42_9 TaxID=1974526 RepID=A0A2H0VZX4_9BACT|nr:MAG: hypothetical protein COT81_05385 [Candidatus Buchananbacteria bacterium CG10_big_fil_rev_8_21_14_0_10_42_9]
MDIRKRIVNQLKKEFENNPNVFAFWLEGSDAIGKNDEYSDLDPWLDVADGKEEEIFNKVEIALKNIASLDISFEVEHPDKKIRQKYYHLKGTSKYLLIDLCIQSHSRKFKFIKGHKYEVPQVIFDKNNVIRFLTIENENLKMQNQQRLHYLENRFGQTARVKKYIKRGKFLEALIYYHEWALKPLVELLRIKYTPLISNYYLVKISDDLPKEALKKVEDLYRVSSISEIEKKLPNAQHLFEATMEEVKAKIKS